MWHERRSDHPLVERSVFSGRNVRAALIVNFVVGAALVIAMVDVPIFINAVEVDVERSAVVAGWVLSALTAAMAVASYVGGRVTEATWYRPPVLVGMALTTSAYLTMGLTWGADTSYVVLAIQLAVLGAGFGLVQAPTTLAVVDHAPADARGSAAASVMVVRLLGLSVGLSALTAYGLARFNQLRREIELPPIVDPGFEDALRAAQADADRRRHRRDVPRVRRRHGDRPGDGPHDAACPVHPPRTPHRPLFHIWTRQENPCSHGCNAT